MMVARVDDVISSPVRHKLDASAFFRMADAGIFATDQRLELIDGDLLDVAPTGQGHSGIVAGLNEALVLACTGRATVWTQGSIRLNNLNVPEPDFAVLRRRADFYATGHGPCPADLLLVIEVSDTSLHFDRTVKLPVYAGAQVPEYWIVDLKGRRVDAYRAPRGDHYAEVATYISGDILALTAAPEIVVSLALFFGYASTGPSRSGTIPAGA